MRWKLSELAKNRTGSARMGMAHRLETTATRSGAVATGTDAIVALKGQPVPEVSAQALHSFLQGMSHIVAAQAELMSMEAANKAWERAGHPEGPQAPNHYTESDFLNVSSNMQERVRDCLDWIR